MQKSDESFESGGGGKVQAKNSEEAEEAVTASGRAFFFFSNRPLPTMPCQRQPTFKGIYLKDQAGNDRTTVHSFLDNYWFAVRFRMGLMGYRLGSIPIPK